METMCKDISKLKEDESELKLLLQNLKKSYMIGEIDEGEYNKKKEEYEKRLQKITKILTRLVSIIKS